MQYARSAQSPLWDVRHSRGCSLSLLIASSGYPQRRGLHLGEGTAWISRSGKRARQGLAMAIEDDRLARTDEFAELEYVRTGQHRGTIV